MKIKNIFSIVVASAAILFSACEGDDDSSIFADGDNSFSVSTSVNNKGIVGKWVLSTSGQSPWYIHFNSDGTWRITDDSAGTALRVYGNYSTSGDLFSGNMTNPGVGTGEIKGSISGSAITLDFIEHWHTPYKHVPYSGSKL